MFAIVKGRSGNWYIEHNGSWYDEVVYPTAEHAVEALYKHSPSAAMGIAFKIPRTRELHFS